MDESVIAMIGVGLALAGLILGQGIRLDRRIDGLRTEINGLRTEMDRRIDGLEGKMDRRFEKVDTEINGLREQNVDLGERMARIEGILTGRTAAAEEALRAQG